jgi:hypothetical protein
MKFITLNQFLLFILFGFINQTKVFSQKQTLYLNYDTELAFQTPNDNKYYHLEATMLIRQVLSDIDDALKKNQAKNQDVEFILIFKNDYGAVKPINYLVKSNSFSDKFSKSFFMKHSYDWINRTFRSNIPYED